jgi:hypothetical protein
MKEIFDCQKIAGKAAGSRGGPGGSFAGHFKGPAGPGEELAGAG